ncbi:MAG TPA: NlpC/P60 family protein [Candidatus Dormibacteraeota bacterium]|nr:NlpC/P60 family protein [Candidatus Dormibacteraeota bacterium]
MNGTVDQVIRHSFLYSYLLSQPFSVYVDAYPVHQNQLLIEAEHLKFGQHGEVVRILQNKLNKLAYYDDFIDGEYGILTEYALKKFQADHYVTITGQADTPTIRALIVAEKEYYLNRLEELSESVYPGMHNEDVKIVQESLHYFGYYKGEIDGIYGPLTKNALEIAEKKHQIKLAEEVTQESLATLYEDDMQAEQFQEVESLQQEMTSNESPNQEMTETENETQIEDVSEEHDEIKVVQSEGYSDHNDVIEAARSFIGTPYVWGGESESGFDCSGFIQYVFQTQDITIPRTVSDIWNFAQPVDSPSVGDLVFFETYQPGPSHLGIYVGDGKFIHAGASRGVEVSELKNSYWDQRYLGAKTIQ